MKLTRMKRIIIAAAGILLLGLTSCGKRSTDKSGDTDSGTERSADSIARDAFPSVVLLVTQDSQGEPLSLASGFVVKEGVVATNFHVMRGAVRAYVKRIDEDRRYDVEGTIAVDEPRDLALLKVSSLDAPPLPLGDSSAVKVGQSAYVIGNPLGLEGTFSEGIVSGVRHVEEDILLQITTPISPGSSGGPVLNGQGHVIGVATAAFKEGQNLNFAIPSSYLSALLAQPEPGDGSAAASAAASGAESTAKAMLEGFSKGDYGTFLDHVDFKGIYEEMVPEDAREEMSYEDFEEQLRAGMAQAPEAPEGFEYKILGSEKKGDTTIVTVRIKQDASAEWEESKVPFKKIDGKWKITAEGMKKLMMEE